MEKAQAITELIRPMIIYVLLYIIALFILIYKILKEK